MRIHSLVLLVFLFCLLFLVSRVRTSETVRYDHKAIGQILLCLYLQRLRLREMMMMMMRCLEVVVELYLFSENIGIMLILSLIQEILQKKEKETKETIRR